MANMNILEEADTPGTPDALAKLRKLTLDELATDSEASRIVARLTRKDSNQSEPVRVAAFNSFI
jgi:hypothetical protein